MNFTYKQPYVTWKGPSTGSAVPIWSRPLINNNTNTNTGTSFAARPIKHWRKQLVPAANTGITRNASMGMPMDRPGSTVYLGATVDCSNCLVNLTDLIPTTKNTKFDNTKDSSGNCVACNPETNIIKSGLTLLNKNYYTDTKAYLQSRCQTYDQKLSTTPIPGNSYINPTTHQPIPPSDSPTGSQVYYTENCSKKCETINSVVRTIYKPNNQQYSQQGSVSSSSRLTRLKNNTITKNGNSFKTAWGQQQANAGRYQGTSDSTYFLKTKNQACVPFHRDGNKTTSCAVPVPDVVEGESIGGLYRTAVVDDGQIYVSTDFGETWNAKDSNRFWTGIAMSADGKRQSAVVLNGQIYISTDFGETWVAKDTNRLWYSIAMSADGNRQSAVVRTGQIYISTDFGETWTASTSINDVWNSIAMSADGIRQSAVVFNGYIYVSSDSGLNWTAKDNIRLWRCIAMSADGMRQTAGFSGGQIYVSTDFGETWTASTSINGNWYSIAMSADGSRQSAVLRSGNIYVSSDYGVSWAAKDSVREWYSISMSADGTRQSAVVNDGFIYVSSDYGETWSPKKTDINRMWWSIAMSK